jgi:hypothetical protein
MIEAGASRNQDLKFLSPFVIQAFDDLPPTGVLVNFVEDQVTCASRKTFEDDLLSVFRCIPVQVSLPLCCELAYPVEMKAFRVFSLESVDLFQCQRVKPFFWFCEKAARNIIFEAHPHLLFSPLSWVLPG